MNKVRTARLTWSRKRISASVMALLWLASTWAAAANWCCVAPTGQTEFPGDAAPAQHERAAHDAHQVAHDHAGEVAEESRQSPADTDCAEVAPVDKGLRWSGVALARPTAEKIFYALALTQWSIGTPKGEALGRWSLPPSPIYQANPFLSTIRLLL